MGDATQARRRHRLGWCAYDFANSAFHQATGAVFAPLAIDAAATARAWALAGSSAPTACDDAVRDGCRECVRGLGARFVTTRDPYTHAAIEIPKLPGGLDPTGFVFLVVSASVLAQACCFVTLGTFGNYGDVRGRFMRVSSRIGSSANVALVLLAIGNEMYWLAGILLAVANVALGVSVVFYNSYLPLMVDADETVVEAAEGAKMGTKSEEEANAVREAVTNEISSAGQGYGYIGGTSALVLGFIAVVVAGAAGANERTSLVAGCITAGLWWGIFGEIAFRYMPADGTYPGLPKPKEGLGYFVGWTNTYATLRKVWHTDRATIYYLILFFFFSDGYSTMTTVSLLFASRELCMGLISLITLAIIVPLFAGVGNFVWLRIQRKMGWTTKQTLVINLLLLGCLPLWGCIGFFTGSIGLQTEWELYALAVLFGFLLGSTQAYARSQFTELIPPGHESDMFALFEITDKGSSWLGPLVAASIVSGTGRIRPMLVYLACELIIPALIVHTLHIKPLTRL